MNTAAKPFDPERLLPYLQGLHNGETWWVSFSGGADSTALLHALWNLREQLPAKLKALHIDHGIHPASAEWSEHCQKVCQGLGIKLHLECIKVTRDTGKGLEAEARSLRYQVAEQIMQPGDVLMTAHHADDQAETVMLNLMRGSGVDGLAGMPNRRPLGRCLLARPLLEFTGASLRLYLLTQQLDWIEDQSNQDLRYDRNFVRHALLPRLEQRWPGARDNMGLSAVHCRQASNFIEQSCTRLLQSCRPASGRLDLAELKSRVDEGFDSESLSLFLRQWLRLEEASPLPRKRLRELLRQLTGADRNRQLEVTWDGWVLHRYRNELWLQSQESTQPCPHLEWQTSQPLELGPGAGTLYLQGPSSLPDWQVRVGPRQGGEKIACMGNGRHRSVKQILQELGIPSWLRPTVPLLWLEGHLVAVADRVFANDFRVRLRDCELQLKWEPGNTGLKTAIEPGDDLQG